MARWIRRRDRAGRVLVIPNQNPGLLARYGVTREEADRAAWSIDRDGRRLEGAAAVNRVLFELGDELGGWRALALPYRLSLVAALEEALYRWFALRRSRFRRLGVTPECDEPGSACG
jgi:predicted DCC family thiol-disulfide oxidoreductase YuxK